MRIHVTCHGKKTTISIDDILMDYLGAWLVDDKESLHANYKVQIEWAASFIRNHVAKYPERLPEKNLSQYLQAVIIRAIAAPDLSNIIKVRGPRVVKPKSKKVDIHSVIDNCDKQIAELRARRARIPASTKPV